MEEPATEFCRISAIFRFSTRWLTFMGPIIGLYLVRGWSFHGSVLVDFRPVGVQSAQGRE